MRKKIAVLVDAGHLRVALRRASQPYTPEYIEKICLQCAKPGEEIVRILYYDCEPFLGELKFPISKQKLPDCIPAMKYARRAGLQVALMKLPGSHQAKELFAHVDFRREITWP
jgi:hypothetical protein